jgi:hypothetical protein
VILECSTTVLVVSSRIEQRYRITGELPCYYPRCGTCHKYKTILFPLDGTSQLKARVSSSLPSAPESAEDACAPEDPGGAVAIADHMLRAATKDITSLPPSVDSQQQNWEKSKIQAGSWSRMSDIELGKRTIQANEPDQRVSGAPGRWKVRPWKKIRVLRESGLDGGST